MTVIMTPTVSVNIDGVGHFSTFADTFDGALRQYGDMSLDELVALANYRTNADFTGVRNKSALILAIADYEGF